jgi:hypothetical protein
MSPGCGQITVKIGQFWTAVNQMQDDYSNCTIPESPSNSTDGSSTFSSWNSCRNQIKETSFLSLDFHARKHAHTKLVSHGNVLHGNHNSFAADTATGG